MEFFQISGGKPVLLVRIQICFSNPKTILRNIEFYFYSFLFQLLFLVDWWSNSEMRMYVDPKVLEEIGSENAVIIANHHYGLFHYIRL